MIKSNIGFFNNQGDVTERQMIWSGQVSNSSKISSLYTLSASLRKIQSKLNVMLMTVKQRPFQQSKGRNSKINDLIWPVSRLHPCPLYLQVPGRFDQDWMIYVDHKVKQRLFQQSRKHNSKINDPIWPGSEVIKLFLCSTQLSMKFSLLINMKMPTIVGIFIFISREIFMISYV